MYPQRDRSPLYPIELPFRYAVSTPERISGEGRTLAIGCRRVQVSSDRPLGAHAKIQLTLPWPTALPDGTRLSLWILGETTRSRSCVNLIQVSKHEFKTRQPVQPARAPGGRGSLSKPTGRIARLGA
jgi:hypothetical protein